MNISTRCPPPGPLRMAFDFSCFRSTMDTGWKLTFVVRRKVGKMRTKLAIYPDLVWRIEAS